MPTRPTIQLFTFMRTLQDDLRAEKIDRTQFNFLLGMFLQREFNLFLGKQVERLAVQPVAGKQLLSLSYRRNRQSHAA